MKLTKYLIPIEFIKLILHDVYLGLNYLHKNKIIFRDLKPENVIIDFNTGICKLIDFGLAYKFNNDEEKLYKICGTYEYLSPEVIKKEGYDYDFDYWTFGVFAYELFYGFSPFTGKSNDEIFENILYQKIILILGENPF
jgi:serine/threonine protein kinase